MKIAFMGKGGSGKTTLTTAFTYFIQNAHKDSPIWLFDADLNSHILDEFGYENEKINYLGGDFETIADLVEPSIRKSNIDMQKAGFGTYPTNTETIYLFPKKESKFTKHYGIKKGNTTFFTIGNYSVKDDPSGKCYHGELNSYELAIHRIKDTQNEYIIADTTAGADNLGTSLYIAYDAVFFVVEPTSRSISVYRDYVSLDEVDISKVFVLANKIEDEDDRTYMEQELGSDKIIAYFSENAKLYNQRSQENYRSFIEENKEAFKKIDSVARLIEKNEKEHYEKIYKLFEKEAKDWYNIAAGVDLLQLYPKI